VIYPPRVSNSAIVVILPPLGSRSHILLEVLVTSFLQWVAESYWCVRLRQHD